MEWDDSLPDSWDDADYNPPQQTTGEIRLVEMNDGYMAQPTESPENGTQASNSIYSDVIMEPDDLDELPWEPDAEKSTE